MLEDSLDDGSEHVDDEARSGVVRAVLREELADLRRGLIVFEQRGEGHDDLLRDLTTEPLLALVSGGERKKLFRWEKKKSSL